MANRSAHPMPSNDTIGSSGLTAGAAARTWHHRFRALFSSQNNIEFRANRKIPGSKANTAETQFHAILSKKCKNRVKMFPMLWRILNKFHFLLVYCRRTSILTLELRRISPSNIVGISETHFNTSIISTLKPNTRLSSIWDFWRRIRFPSALNPDSSIRISKSGQLVELSAK